MEKNIAILIFGMVFSQSCQKSCKDFPPSFILFESLSEDDIMEYTDGTDTITFSIENISLNDPVQKVPIIAMDVYCEYKASYSTNTVGGYKIEEHAEDSHYNDNRNICLTENDCFSLYLLDIPPEVSVMSLGDTVINSVKYTDVLILQKENLSSEEKVDKIIHNHQVGLIQFRDNETGKTWSRVF